MTGSVLEIRRFILARLEENVEQVPGWQIILDRRLVKLHGVESSRCDECADGCSCGKPVESQQQPCNTLCFLALRWPEHVDFNPKWNIL
jgi:hypothetical protein